MTDNMMMIDVAAHEFDNDCRTTLMPMMRARTAPLPPGRAARLLQYRNSEYGMPLYPPTGFSSASCMP